MTAFVFFLLFYLVRSFTSTDADYNTNYYSALSPHTSIGLAIDNIL